MWVDYINLLKLTYICYKLMQYFISSYFPFALDIEKKKYQWKAT